MQLSRDVVALLAMAHASFAVAKSMWSFDDATVQIQNKAGNDGSSKLNKEKLSLSKPLASPITLGSTDSVRVSLTTLEDKKAKRPHQAFLTFFDPSSGLEESYTLGVKETGKGSINVAQKDIPTQLLDTSAPLQAFIAVGSFGSSDPIRAHVFDLLLPRDSSSTVQSAPMPLRYGKLPEIHHIFKSDSKSPPVVITIAFGCMVFTSLPVLLGVWLELGMNLSHVFDAFSTAPVAHGLFIGSIVVLEVIFLMYYVSWNLFQTLPPVAIVGALAFLSGSRALREVQGRRLAGER